MRFVKLSCTSLQLLCWLYLVLPHLANSGPSNALSRPPAPLSQSKGDDFVTLSFRVDPNDYSGTLHSIDDLHYSLQMENRRKGVGDFIGSWVEAIDKIEAQASRSEYFATAKVSGLSSDFEYR